VNLILIQSQKWDTGKKIYKNLNSEMDIQISDVSVTQLKRWLELLKLPTTGSKAELFSRLRSVPPEDRGVVPQVDQEVGEIVDTVTTDSEDENIESQGPMEPICGLETMDKLRLEIEKAQKFLEFLHKQVDSVSSASGAKSHNSQNFTKSDGGASKSSENSKNRHERDGKSSSGSENSENGQERDGKASSGSENSENGQERVGMATNSSENSENRRERVGERSSGSTKIVQGNFENLQQLGCADYGGINGRDAHRTSDEIST